MLQFGDYQGSQEVEAMQEVVTRSILRTAFGDGRRGSIRAERMPLAFMWMHGELQEEFRGELQGELWGADLKGFCCKLIENHRIIIGNH